MKTVTRIEVILMLARASDAGMPGNGPAGRCTPWMLATTFDKVQRMARTLERMHEQECNGDHQRCKRCGGGQTPDGRRGACPACDGTGHNTEAEREAFAKKRDRLEAACIAHLAGVGISARINRDPRGGPIVVGTCGKYMGALGLVLPLKGGF